MMDRRSRENQLVSATDWSAAGLQPLSELLLPPSPFRKCDGLALKDLAFNSPSCFFRRNYSLYLPRVNIDLTVDKLIQRANFYLKPSQQIVTTSSIYSALRWVAASRESPASGSDQLTSFRVSVSLSRKWGQDSWWLWGLLQIKRNGASDCTSCGGQHVPEGW